MGDLRFSGHESFQCRNLWLKKGFDFIENGSGNFNADEAVLSLGVGKNMTTSIRYWMEAMGLKNKNNLSQLAFNLLSNDGWDPYLENVASLWLLHYELVSNNHASIYNLIFNHFRKYRTEFTKDHLITFIKNKTSENNKLPADSTLNTDVGVFLSTYVKPNKEESKKNLEDQFSSLLLELNLIKPLDEEVTKDEKKNWYKFAVSDQESLPNEIFLYSILDNDHFKSNSISIQQLLNAENSPGSIFLLNPDTLISKIESLVSQYENIVYTDDGGIRQIQINDKENINPIDVLIDYYV